MAELAWFWEYREKLSEHFKASKYFRTKKAALEFRKLHKKNWKRGAILHHVIRFH